MHIYIYIYIYIVCVCVSVCLCVWVCVVYCIYVSVYLCVFNYVRHTTHNNIHTHNKLALTFNLLSSLILHYRHIYFVYIYLSIDK